MSRQLFRILDTARIPNCSPSSPAELDPEIERQKLDAAAAEERARLREASMEAGREEGYRVGYAAGMASGQADLALLLDTIKAEAIKLDLEIASLAPTVVTQVLDLGVRLAEALTGSPTLFDRAGALTALLTDVREQAPPRTRISFQVHPDTLALLDQTLLADIEVMPDLSLREGGGIFEIISADTNQIISRLDASIERRLERLREQGVRGPIAP